MKYSKKLLLLSAVTSTGTAAFAAHSGCGQKETSPNIIFILVDDMGVGDLGCYGGDKINTPCLDRMAAEGMLFTNAYCGSSVSAPSRATLLTGQHTGHCTLRALPGFGVNGPVDLKDDDPCVAREMQKAGYKTAVIGKWGLAENGFESMPSRRGFDYFFGYKTHLEAHSYYPSYLWRNDEKVDYPDNDPLNTTGQYSHDLFTGEALDYIKENKDNKFFLYLTYTAPHFELTVPEDSKKPYMDKGWPVRPLKRAHYRHDPDGNLAYAGMVSRMDGDVGRIMSLLEELGIDENTIVFFSSDNGPEYDINKFFCSSGGLKGGKRSLYEGGLRCPMIAWWPKHIEGGSRSAHMTAFWDFYPTACELAGVRPDSKGDGISFVNELKGKKQKRHEYLYWELNQKEGPIQAVRKNQWKAVRFLDKPTMLFDLSQDKGERNNVAGEYPEVVKDMERIMKRAHTDSEDFPIDRFVYTPKKKTK